MIIEINNISWEIEELTQEQIKIIQNERNAKEDENIKSISDRYLGITYTDINKIYIDKNLPEDRKRKTLLHELTHCYIESFITHTEKQYTEEEVADIVANSFYIIKDIIEKYFKKEE